MKTKEMESALKDKGKNGETPSKVRILRYFKFEVIIEMAKIRLTIVCIKSNSARIDQCDRKMRFVGILTFGGKYFGC